MRKNRFKRAGALSTAAVMAAMSTGCAMDSSAPATTAAPAPVTVAETTQAVSAPSQPDVENEKPNIVYIMLDDTGYSDFGCYGSTINTPNLDALAQQGILYSDYYT